VPVFLGLLSKRGGAGTAADRRDPAGRTGTVASEALSGRVMVISVVPVTDAPAVRAPWQSCPFACCPARLDMALGLPARSSPPED